MRQLIAILATLILLALGPGLAQSASAAVKCQYDPGTQALSVTANEKGLLVEEPTLHRVGEQIRVSEFFGPRVNCHGNPTVTNTDQITLRARGVSEITIGLGGGPLAPGATPEPDGSSEIEIVALGGSGTFWLNGGPGADHFRYMSEAGQSGLDLNAGPGDEDVDLFVPSPRTEVFVEGRGGPDTIDVVAPVDVEVAAFGEGGNDTLIGGTTGTAGEFTGGLLEGGKGRDRIVGSPLFDFILPGPGADVVKAEGGSDAIQMSPDKRRDRIDCGGGRDVVGGPRAGKPPGDPRDRFRGCEHVQRGRRR